MNLIYRKGQLNDLVSLKQLAMLSWKRYQKELSPDNCEELSVSLTNDNTYLTLLKHSDSILCETDDEKIIGMAFIVPSGNPTEIFDESWSYLRFVTVHPEFAGQGVGRILTEQCIEIAKQNNEKSIALHTSVMMKEAIQIYESLGFKVLLEIEPRLGKQYWLYILHL
jgi:ribosomal protein S18 acetylase RimI-like enzyme